MLLCPGTHVVQNARLGRAPLGAGHGRTGRGRSGVDADQLGDGEVAQGRVAASSAGRWNRAPEARCGRSTVRRCAKRAPGSNPAASSCPWSSQAGAMRSPGRTPQARPVQQRVPEAEARPGPGDGELVHVEGRARVVRPAPELRIGVVVQGDRGDGRGLVSSLPELVVHEVQHPLGDEGLDALGAKPPRGHCRTPWEFSHSAVSASSVSTPGRSAASARRRASGWSRVFESTVQPFITSGVHAATERNGWSARWVAWGV